MKRPMSLPDPLFAQVFKTRVQNQRNDNYSVKSTQSQESGQECCTCHSIDNLEELSDLQRKSHSLLKERFKPEYFRHHIHTQGKVSAATALTKDSAPWSAFIVVHPILAFKLRAITTAFQEVDKFFLDSSEVEEFSKMTPGVYLRLVLPNRTQDCANGCDAVISVMTETFVPKWATDQFSEIRDASSQCSSLLEGIKGDYNQLDVVCKGQWGDVVENISERVHVMQSNLAVLLELQQMRRTIKSSQAGIYTLSSVIRLSYLQC